MDIKYVQSAEQKACVIKLFNRQMQYAPYTVKMTPEFLEHALRDAANYKRSLVLAEYNGAYGALHYGVFDHAAHIYLLIADTAEIGERLLEWLEDQLLRQGIPKIRCYVWEDNPYRYLVYGTESYCWAGLYTANNAYRRRGYDVVLDVLPMRLSLKTRPDPALLSSEAFEISHEILQDDAMVLHGQFNVSIGGVKMGGAGYYHLRAISSALKTNLGEVDIWFESNLHASGVPAHIMALCHQKLYNIGCRTVVLATNQQLYRAVRFYEKFEYTHESIRAYCYELILIRD